MADLSHLSDESLLELISAEGSHAAFSVIVKRYAVRFRNIAHRYTGSKDDAEDIVQDAFIKLWDRPELWNVNRNAKFTTWFYRVIVNQCLDFQRKHKMQPLSPDQDFADESLQADEELSANQKQKEVESAFRSLPQNMQASLNMSFFDPIPNKEAADIMGMSLKAFQSLVIRAKNTLKDKLKFSDFNLENEFNKNKGDL